MRLKSNNSTHLSYCTNIHAGDNWNDVFPQLQRELPKIKAKVSPDAPFGIGLRVSKLSAQQLVGDTLQEFTDWMSEEGIYVFTINGFPFGPFHGTTVKEDVYKPDWADKERLDYTCELIDLCAKLNPPDNYATISTIPGTYKQWARGNLPVIAENLIKAVAHSLQVERDTGVRVALSLEPEPCCLLETTEETIQFFEQWLHSDAAVSLLSEIAKCTVTEADEALHRLIGVCYDVCHSAVEFEEPAAAIAQFKDANIPIIKMQLSSALRLPEVNNEALNHLAEFNEPVYLHQVVEKLNGKLNRFTDLGDAIAWREAGLRQAFVHVPAMDASSAAIDIHNLQAPPIMAAEWRVHFHVPVFIKNLEHFGTTQEVLENLLSLQKNENITQHLEVETYTWDVLPENLRSVEIDEAIARELSWVSDRL